MDLSSPPPETNWLGFYLPNHHSFTSNAATGGAPYDGVSAGLSVFSGGPKLDDFLGGASAVTPPPQHQLDLSPFAAHHSLALYDTHQLYGSAASFLNGFSSSAGTDHHNPQTDSTIINQNNKKQILNPVEPPPKKAADTFGHRTSIYRGVTRHRWTGRYEAHLWDNSCRREGQSRKGRQVYLGGYDKEEKAARAYDLAALKYWGPTTTTNIPLSSYEKELEEMKNMTRQEFVASLRRKSSGFSRGASMYRGVTRHHQHGRWQARIGRVAGNKDLYLGTFSTQEEAAEAYDIAAIKFRGLNAVTNFDMSRYDVKSIASSNLPIGGGSKNTGEDQHLSMSASSSTLSFAKPSPMKQDQHYWPIVGYQQNNNASLYHPHHDTAALDMDFSAASSLKQSSNNGGSFNEGGGGGCFHHHQQQQQQQQHQHHQQQEVSNSSSCSILPNGTANGSNSNSDNNDEWCGGGGYVAPTFQSAKPNLCVFQTPIFGME